MKWYLSAVACLLAFSAFSQNIAGKWYGKLSQGPGGYSELYDLNLEINQSSTLWGDSYASHGDSVKITIGFSGSLTADGIRLNESLSWVREDKVPLTYQACIKTFELDYRKEGDFEYLEGDWKGYGKEDPLEDCIPGRVILSRSVQGLEEYLKIHKGLIAPSPTLITSLSELQKLDFTESFRNTIPKKATEIIVHQPELYIQLIDYMKVDNDTVSVYLNRNLLAKDIWISKRPAIVKFTLDTRIELHELLLYAENLGAIPPNTSELILVDGKFRHRVMISSDMQQTAAVYLRYNPDKPHQ